MQNNNNSRVLNIIFSNLRIVFLLFLFLVIFGVSSLASMQKEGFPDVLVNIALVTVPYPNATAVQVEDQIIKPIEAALSEVESVSEYETTANDNFAVAIVTLDSSADIKEAISEIKQEVGTVKLPEDAGEVNVDEFSISGVGQFVIGVTGPEDPWELHEATKQAQRKIEAIPGIKMTTAVNPLTPEILLTFNEEALKENNLQRMQVEQIIKLANFSAPVGSVLGADEKTLNIVLEKDLDSVDDLKNLLLADGVVLSDVATVEIRLNNNSKYNRVGYRDFDNNLSDLHIDRAIMLSVFMEKDADILDVDDALQEFLSVEKDNPENTYKLAELYNQAEETRVQVDEITASVFGTPIDALGPFGFLGYMFGGLGLVVILLFIFMNARVAIMAASAIPLSLFFSAIYLQMIDINLNTLVLFSMVLVIGLVVDPTIVFLESMQRFKAQGFSGRIAAEKTMQTVGTGVLLAVTTNILVFVPFGVVSGFFGEIIKYIPITVIPAMVASMLIPVLFFVPLASKILSSKKVERDSEDPDLSGTWWVSKKLKKVILFILGPRKLKIGLRILIVLLAFSLPAIIGFVSIKTGAMEVVQFSSEEDTYIMVVNGEIDQSFTFEKSAYEVVVPLQNLLAEQPEILNFSFFQQQGNSFTMLVTLLPIEEREEEGMRKANIVAEDLNEEIKKLELDANVEASVTNAGPPTSDTPVKIRFMDDDPEVLALAVKDVSEFLMGLEEVTETKDNLSNGTTGGSVTLSLAKDDIFAQNPAMIYSMVSSKLGESEIAELSFNDEKYEIFSRSDGQITSEEEIYDLVVGVKLDGLLPVEITIDDVVMSSETKASQSIRRMNGRRFAEVSAKLTEDADIIATQALLDEYLNEEKLEELGLSKDSLSSKGEADFIADSFTDLFVALGISIFLIYVLLVAFLRSYIEPFIILAAIPLGLVGVFTAVIVTGGQLGFMELLGVVTMAGIVVNVTILLLDYANQLKRAGRSPADAIATAVGVRFRPIVLTQITAFGSLIPLVIISPFWKGLALAIVLGIVSSALLSLFVTPILYLWVHSFTRNMKKIPGLLLRMAKFYKKSM